MKKELAKLPVENAIIDGEIVCLDARALASSINCSVAKPSPSFTLFDLLWLNGEDLRNQPLTTRKKRLARLIHSTDCPRILYAQYIEQYGKRFFEEICNRDLEGIVAKRKLSIYKDDGQSWLKI